MNNFHKEEKPLEETDRVLASGHYRMMLKVIPIFLLPVIGGILLYKYEVIKGSSFIGICFAFVIALGVLLFNFLKMQRALKAGVKIVEQVIVVSSTYELTTPYLLFNNGMKCYMDAVKRSGLKRSDLPPGTSLTIYYLPVSNYFFLLEKRESAVSEKISPVQEESAETNKVTEKEFLFSTKGRIRRKTYAIRLVISTLLLIVLLKLPLTKPYGGWILLVYIAFITIQVVKRLHDVDQSGWSFFVPFKKNRIFEEGTIGRNKYGEDPKKEEHAIL